MPWSVMRARHVLLAASLVTLAEGSLTLRKLTDGDSNGTSTTTTPGPPAAVVTTTTPSIKELSGTCKNLYQSVADTRRDAFMMDETEFANYSFRVSASPYFRIAYTVNHDEQYFDMVIGARTTGFIGIGFYGDQESKAHAMVNTDMIFASIGADGSLTMTDSFAIGLRPPWSDARMAAASDTLDPGARDQLLDKRGREADGVTYVKFRRSFRPEDLDEYDFKFRSDMERVAFVYAYSSVNEDSGYHGPTRGYGQMPWNVNCSSNRFWNLRTSACEGCDRGLYRIPSDPDSELTRCERCPLGTFADAIGDQRPSPWCESCGHPHTTTLFPGAASHTDCVCEPGFYHPCDPGPDPAHALGRSGCRLDKHGNKSEMRQAFRHVAFCVPCPQGMKCTGGAEGPTAASAGAHGELTHAQPRVPPGYWARREPGTGELSVFKCVQRNHCPGGGLQTCAAGRGSLSCAECLPGMVADASGACADCTGGDGLPVAVTCLGMFAILAAAYHLIDREDRTRSSHSMLLVAIAGGQAMTVLQILGVLGNLSLDLTDPFRGIVFAMKVFVFDLEFLHIGCIATISPLTRFVFTAFMMLVVILSMVLVHCAFVLVRHSGHFAERRASLVGACGTCMMAFFISTVSTVLAPFQCNPHPNGMRTIRNFPTVLCWEGGEQISMLALGGIALLLPLGFIAWSAYVVHTVPSKLRAGRTAFLRAHSFLLFRFRVETRWYSVFFLIRNLVIAAVPIIPDAALQILAMQLVLMCSLTVICTFMPWRVYLANVLDGVIIMAMLLVVSLSTFYIEQPNTQIIAHVCFGMALLCIVAVPVAASHGFYTKMMHRSTKPYTHFLCHHKLGAGCYARLLKMQLVSALRPLKRRGLSGEVFLDSDDLKDLDSLFDVVGSQTLTFVVLVSDAIFTRPWCLGEMVAAMSNNVITLLVMLPSTTLPSDDFIQDIDTLVPDTKALGEYGIQPGKIRETLQWLRQLSRLSLTSAPTMISLGETAVTLVNAALHTLGSHMPWQSHPTGEGSLLCMDTRIDYATEGSPETGCLTAIIVDHTDFEAISCALILRKMLLPVFVHVPVEVPYIVPVGRDLPQTVTKALLVCTHGLFEQPDTWRWLLETTKRDGFYFLPILADRTCGVPTAAKLQSCEPKVAAAFDESGLPRDTALLFNYVSSIFKEIGIAFNPNEYVSTITVLEAKVQEMLIRLTATHRASSMGQRCSQLTVQSMSASVPLQSRVALAPSEAPLTANETPVTANETPRTPSETPRTPSETSRTPSEAPRTPSKTPRSAREDESDVDFRSEVMSL